MDDKKRSRVLLGILVVLVLLIVGLVITIVLTNNSTWRKCKDIEDEYEKSGCLMEEVNNDDDSELAYEKVLNDAFNNKEYGVAANLILNKVESLAIDGECEEANRLMDDNRIHEFSDDLLLGYYSYMFTVAVDCDDEEKQAELRSLMGELDEDLIEDETLVDNQGSDVLPWEDEEANQESEEIDDVGE